ncbi:3-deoxy-8-phosphooctulonate synthase [Paenibacillus sp. H1-7]|uniref:3-deoxy-8-phosphooctulonate synthase n=1 Tax=Paenibacillus sp. H1-7 TaxID=2282849 RepID=UPI001EF98555|nr:3-deoxy-8-phosphooctulonate synthase [Paenibacillus sp. H1-7]ULL19034.1 3-deoxy-8-phosphooctulonate synthase [Paenibacillus sp. H1-7]
MEQNKFQLIAGPCVIEDEGLVMEIAQELERISKVVNIPIVFKASYDKANRSSATSFRGPGITEGLKILHKVKSRTGLPVLSDIHETSEVEAASEVLDILQIPAFLCRQTDLILKAAASGKTVNIKKGQFMAPWDMKNVVDKVESTGNKNLLLTERGTSFGYNNLVVDFRSFMIMREWGYPVIFDATHSIQIPGGNGTSSSGERKYVPSLVRAAVAFGIDGLFMEVHPNPDKALSDGPNMLPLSELEGLLKKVITINNVQRGLDR